LFFIASGDDDDDDDDVSSISQLIVIKGLNFIISVQQIHNIY